MIRNILTNLFYVEEKYSFVGKCFYEQKNYVGLIIFKARL